MKKVCVYCGSSSGKRPEYAESARSLAKELTKRGMGLVYGGASVGIMGEIADAICKQLCYFDYCMFILAGFIRDRIRGKESCQTGKKQIN